jgi:hypothetical protein
LASAEVAAPTSPIAPCRESGVMVKKGTAVVIGLYRISEELVCAIPAMLTIDMINIGITLILKNCFIFVSLFFFQQLTD